MATSAKRNENFKNHMNQEEARENFKQEALAAWAAYQETGLHLTGQEIQDWLNTWGTDKETEIPPCHK